MPGPRLWVTYATALFFSGRHAAVEQKLQAAEAALDGAELDDRTRDLVGRIASIRATLAIMQRDRETIIDQSRRALEYLHPDNLPIRTAATYTLGYAQQLQGDRAAASQAYAEVIRTSASLAAFHLHHRGDARSGPGSGTATPNCCWRSRPTSASCNWSVIRHGDSPPKRILDWRVSHTNGTTWRPQTGMGNRASDWRARWIALDTVASYGVLVARLRLAQDDVAGALAALDEAEAFCAAAQLPVPDA